MEVNVRAKTFLPLSELAGSATISPIALKHSYSRACFPLLLPNVLSLSLSALRIWWSTMTRPQLARKYIGFRYPRQAGRPTEAGIPAAIFLFLSGGIASQLVLFSGPL